MFKKITIALSIFFLYGIGNTYAQGYNDYSSAPTITTQSLAVDEGHKILFGDPLVIVVGDYIRSKNGVITSADVAAIADIVRKSILAHGGWGGKDPGYSDDSLVQLDGSRLTVGCGNEPLVLFIIGCDNYEWQCHWEDCVSNNDIDTCTGEGTCTQKYICEEVITSDRSCPGGTTGSDDSEIITKTITGSGLTCECGTADGKSYEYNINNWSTSDTFCKSNGWVINPTSPGFPDKGKTSIWSCSYDSNSVLCSASRKTQYKEYCGDGIVQKPNDDGIYEACDDGNLNNYDSCSNNCEGGGSSSYCGDKNIDKGEDCDDGNTNNYDSCPNNCSLGTSIIKYCGDGEIQSLNTFGQKEECDDGNNLAGDGCSSTCTIIGGGYCGDGDVQIGEECDDGDNNNNNECSNSCALPHTSNPGEKTYCGNGKKETPNYFGYNEECDDGNTNNNDLCTNNCTLLHTSQPGETNIIASSTCDLSGSGYANNLDQNMIYAKIEVIGGVEGNKDVIDLGTATGFIDLSNNLSDRIYNKGNSSLHFEGLQINWDPTKGSVQNIPIAKVSSVTPFTSCNNKVSFKLGGKTMIINDVGYNFKKPFIGELKSSDGTDISLGTKIGYKLSALPVISGFSNYALGLNENNISYLGDNITLQNTKLLNYTGIGYREFESRINSSSNATSLNKTPGIQVIKPIISYTYNGQIVRYYLSAYDYGDDKTPIKVFGSVFIGIKIIGGLQGAGKYEFTGQGNNISNLYPSDLRTEIRKRAYDYTKNMTNGQVLNRVKYVTGEDIVISGDLDYETLIVKDGNVIISGNLNPSNNRLGIIILKDGYDVNTGYNHKGNILVKPDVTTINAMIYADGAFMSAGEDEKVYYPDSTERTNALQRQLTMNGVMFTRNTIGGAQFVGGYYTIPGGIRTMSYDKSMVYDLNYIRRGNVGCYDSNSDGDCEDTALGEINEGFIIKYDSRIQTNPPKLFSK